MNAVTAYLREVAYWADALTCYAFPRYARWGAAVVDRFDGEQHPINSVRFRSQTHAELWAASACDRFIKRGLPDVTIVVAPLREAKTH